MGQRSRQRSQPVVAIQNAIMTRLSQRGGMVVSSGNVEARVSLQVEARHVEEPRRKEQTLCRSGPRGQGTIRRPDNDGAPVGGKGARTVRREMGGAVLLGRLEQALNVSGRMQNADDLDTALD